MGTVALRNRDNWQTDSGFKAEAAEKTLYEVMTVELLGTPYVIREKPKELKNIYTDIKLSEEVLSNIYNPNETWEHGIVPDYSIENIETKKIIYVENKRQDGWVENKPRKAGRGNAHERLCKYFTPGLQRILKKHCNLDNDILPFWIVLQGDVARDPKRVREIHCWFEGQIDHFFLWMDSSNATPLINHFNMKIKPLLD